MLPEQDQRDDEITMFAGGEAMGDAEAAGPAGSNGPEHGASADTAAPLSVPPEAPAPDAARTAETRPEQESPLITAIEIENFKGIGRPVRIELRPVTLLFGRNSAGKSTVLHALCYAQEILSHGNVDVRQTDLGGDQIDLGGFRQFVHRHDVKRPVRLRFELSLRNRNWPSLQRQTFNPEVEPFPTPDELVGAVESGWVELTTRWREDQNGPILSEYEVGVDGQLLGRLEVVPQSDRPKRVGIAISGSSARFRPSVDLFLNLLHPVLQAETWRDLVAPSLRDDDTGDLPRQRSDRPGLHKQAVGSLSALPVLDRDLPVTGDDYDDFYHAVSVVFLGVGTLICRELATSRYIGPLRSLSPRGEEGRNPADSGLWADGSAAWDILHQSVSGGSIVDDVNSWISHEKRLNTGYELRVRSTAELSGDNPLVRRILDWKKRKSAT